MNAGTNGSKQNIIRELYIRLILSYIQVSLNVRYVLRKSNPLAAVSWPKSRKGVIKRQPAG